MKLFHHRLQLITEWNTLMPIPYLNGQLFLSLKFTNALISVYISQQVSKTSMLTSTIGYHAIEFF
jgi:hypothetical protein